jgi:hypothetical protein
LSTTDRFLEPASALQGALGGISAAAPKNFGHGYQLRLEVRDGVARVSLAGSLDESAADAIGGILSGPGQLPGSIELLLDAVVAVEPSGLELIVAAARERVQHGQPSVQVLDLSPAVTAALTQLGVNPRPPVRLDR